MEGLTRRRVSGIFVACALVAAGGIAVARASAGPPEQTGVFALLGGTPKIVSKFWAVHGPGLSATLKIRQFQLDGKTPILSYDVDMQRTIHLLVVRDDFATFAHLHPDFNTTTGTFGQPFTKEPNHRYYAFADTVPHGAGPQVFRFTMESDGAAASPNPSLAASAPSVAAGPYTATLATTTLTANQAQSINLTIDKGAAPADDLGTYLGAPAHCFFINATTLSYLHLHARTRGDNSSTKGKSGSMNMGGAPSGPLMKIDVPALTAGTYEVWIQFRGGSYKLYAAQFTVAVQ